MPPQEEYPAEVPVSSGRLVMRLRLVIAWFLIFTSIPCGFSPFLIAGAYRGMQHEEHINLKWRNQRRIESDKRVLCLGLSIAATTVLIQCVMSWLAWHRWNTLLLGLRGAGWFALLWSAFALGAAFGIWIYSVAPE